LVGGERTTAGTEEEETEEGRAGRAGGVADSLFTWTKPAREGEEMMDAELDETEEDEVVVVVVVLVPLVLVLVEVELKVEEEFAPRFVGCGRVPFC